MKSPYEELKACCDYAAAHVSYRPKIALVLGSGLGPFADSVQAVQTLSYADIPCFPQSTVKGHAGKLIFGECEGIPAVIMQGRVHLYEGYTAEQAVRPIRLMRSLGAEILILTNAAGGIRRGMRPGDFMLITDQISSFVPSPLRGPNFQELGVRFPDMSEIYSKRLGKIVRRIAADHDIPLHEGVYLQTAGPAYESPAEIAMFRTLGADAVGMSTAIEAVAARHCGMEICGISCISNLAAGISPHPLSHAEVESAGKKAEARFSLLIRELLRAIQGSGGNAAAE